MASNPFFAIILMTLVISSQYSCNTSADDQDLAETRTKTENNFQYYTEQFADFRILRYEVPGFNELTLKQKQLAYYLYEAALCGRDIFYDQGFKNNLIIRKTLEAIINSGKADVSSEEGKKFMVYTKRVWFSNGIHHVYSNNKMIPECSQEWFTQQVKQCDPNQLPLNAKSVDEFIQFVIPVIFDPNVAAKKVNLDKSADLIKTSAVNIYENVSQEQVTSFYKNLAVKGDTTPPSYGLNTKLMSQNGTLIEKVWKVGGMYSPAIEKIVSWLTKASAVAENPHQQNVINLLIDYYKTGDLKKFDQYSIEWVKDTSVVDFVNGFIEVYHDPLGYKGSWEAYVSLKDMEATKRIHAISSQAQWFEDNSPLLAEHKKKNVKGISAKVINVVVEAGDLAPLTAIGINLPNAEWIREQHGSKSVTINNITHAYAEDGKNSGVVEEFYYNDTIKTRLKKFGSITDNLHTDMHEVIGHASGQINPGTGTFNETLKNYANTLEEARADLVALYYMIDPKLVEIGVMPTAEAGLSEYDRYINNGMMIQLTRLPANEHQLEEAHMRNRQMIAGWCYENGIKDNVIEKVSRDGKTYFVVRDYKKLGDLFGQLLREVQRVKSEGDYNAGSALVENYGVKVDPTLHKEVLERYQKLNISPYKGFIQPKLVPVMNGSEITDVRLEYPDDFTKQMLEYSKNYSLLPDIN